MRLLKRFATKVALTMSAMLATTALVATPAASAYHYQGGDYHYCAKPTDGAYQGVWVEGWGIGSDGPTRNYSIAGQGRVIYAASCKRAGAVYFPVAARIVNIGVKINGLKPTYGSKQDFTWYRTPTGNTSHYIRPACGAWVRTVFTYDVRYNDGRTFRGTAGSGWFKRCG